MRSCDLRLFSVQPEQMGKKSEAARKTDIEKRVTAGIIPDCGFRILLCVSGWC